MGSPESKGQHAVPKSSSGWWGGRVETSPLVFQNSENLPSHTGDPCQCSHGLVLTQTHTRRTTPGPHSDPPPLPPGHLTQRHCLS